MENVFTERVEKYLKLSHQTLAEMLALREEEDLKKSDIHDGTTTPLQPNSISDIPSRPWEIPWHGNYLRSCPLTTGGLCSNPQMDCINCPYSNITVSYNTDTTIEVSGDTKKSKKKLND